jgi:NADH-quinone oxidoreductase subunit L
MQHRPVSQEHAHTGIHESPRVMLVPLVILAVLSVVGGWIGVPGSLGGSNHFDKFLAPVFHTTIPSTEAQGMPPEERTEGTEPAAGRGQELMYTGISVFAAALGLYLAWLLYLRRPQLPAEIAHALGRIYVAVANKYYVDELYAILFVNPVVEGSSRILWRGIDQNVIDGTVNDSADSARHISDSLRHMQSGNIRSYAGWVAVGAAAVIAYMVWLGVR